MDSIDLQHVCSHCGLERNEAADGAAKLALETFTRDEEAAVPISVPSLRSALKAELQQRWISLLRPNTPRMRAVGPKPSSLAKRGVLPRPVQCTYSQWRCGETLTLGTYPRRLGIVRDPTCGWCKGSTETIHHLLHDCPATHFFRQQHGLSLETLKADSEAAAKMIFTFQEYLLGLLPGGLAPPSDGHVHRRKAGEDAVPPAARRRLNPAGRVGLAQ